MPIYSIIHRPTIYTHLLILNSSHSQMGIREQLIIYIVILALNSSFYLAIVILVQLEGLFLVSGSCYSWVVLVVYSSPMLTGALNRCNGRIILSFRRLISLDTVRVNGMSGFQEPNAPVPGRNPIWSETGSDIFKDLKSGDKIFVHGASGTPSVLLSYLYQHIRSNNINNINVISLLPMGPQSLLNEDVKDKLRLTTPLASKINAVFRIAFRQILS